MCYSKEVSIGTFLVGTFFSLAYAFSGGVSERILGFFLAFVSSMQAIEAIVWSHQECDAFHKGVSILGMVLNHLQPLVLGGLAVWFGTVRSPALFWSIFWIYAISIFLYSLQYIREENLHCTTRQCGNPHLVWNWNILPYNQPIYLLFLGTMCAMAILGFPSRQMGVLFSLAAVTSYGLSTLLYDRKVVGAMWCFFTAYVPVFLVARKSLF